MSIGDIFNKLYKYMDPCKALKLLISHANPIIEEVSIRDALWRVVSEPIYSPVDRPWTDLSHVDGYAICSRDTESTLERRFTRLRIIKGIDPRNADTYNLKSGEAVFVETGYPIPRGADAVVPVESTRVEEGYVLVYRRVPKWFNVFRRGSDVRRGELIIDSGVRVTPQIQKLLIDLGVDKVVVYRRPRVALLAVGSELSDQVVAPSTKIMPASSNILVRHIIEYYGGDVRYEAIVGDDPREIVGVVEDVRKLVDMVATIGGVSMGPRDYTWTSLMDYYKPDKWFRGLKIHPGRSTSGLVIDDTIVVNLPGLPQSTIAGSLFTIIPLLNYLQGLGLEHRLPYIEARLGNRVVLDKYLGFYRVRYARIDYAKGEVYVESHVESYHVSPIARANGLTIIEPGVKIIERGTVVKVYLLEPLYRYSRV